ncbi:MAG: TonB-dependent receptor [Bacteroidetes bacterium]|nr:TonB-dependent receptor [Bacteroidota bacterium]
MTKKILKLQFIFLFFVAHIAAQQSQNANIRGFIYAKDNGEPVLFTNVYLKGTSYGATSDVNGYYSITKVPPGSYVLMVTYLGYDTLQENITVKAGEIVTKKVFLNKASVRLGAVEISAAKMERKTETQVSVNKITPKEINLVPSVGGEPDLAQYLQILPGVVFTGDQGGQLYIRGGSPVQNKVLLDGMIVYNPFHSIGLFSVFDADIIRNADIYTGGFGAEYGGRISSIMDIKTRDGNKKRISGKVSASPFVAKALLEGPLKKNSDEDRGSSSFVLSAKHSYLPQTSKAVYNYVDTAGLPFGFTDFYGKVSANSANGSKINLFGFNFRDNVTYKALSKLNWKSSGVGSNFILIPPSSATLIQGNFAFSKYGVEMLGQSDEKPRKSDINGFNAGLNFTYFFGLNEVQYGLDMLGFKTNFEFYNSVNQFISQTENTTELAGFVKVKFLGKKKKLILEPSFRAHYYASLANFSPEPRLSGKYNITNKIRFKFAGGLYSQNLISANSDRDVVNLFYGFLSGSDNLPARFTEEDGSVRDVKHKLQKANHIILGTEFDLTSNLELNVEAYQKNFTQLTNINRNKLYEDNANYATKPDALKKDFIIETGYARGLDFLLKYDYKRFYVWTVYSLTYVRRWDGIEKYAPHFDRRHNINIVTAYKFGKHTDWEVDLRWNFGSGFPFTQTQGFYEKLSFTNGINSNYTNQNGELGILYSSLNGGRLPDYHRLDITVKKRFEFSERSRMEVAAGVTNAYNRDNIFYFDRILYKRVNQLPLLPSLSANWTF